MTSSVHESASIRRLPPPAGGASVCVLEALQRRKTTREISARPLSDRLLSNLLWAAAGVNRVDGPFDAVGRTAASASNSQEIDVYVLLSQGAFRYDASQHSLELAAAQDLRADALTPGQRGVKSEAPVQLVFVADIDKLVHTAGFQEPGLHDADVQKSYYFVDAGLIAGNVYLFAAAEGLAAWFHNCDRTALARRLGLRADQHVLFAQSVGYPAAN